MIKKQPESVEDFGVTPTPVYQDKPRKAPFVRSQSLDYDTNKASNDTGLSCPEPTLTQQHFEEECNINFIAEKFHLTGEMPQVLDLPKSGDFTGIFDFQAAQNSVRRAIEQFGELPAKVRAHFDNSPAKLMEFMDDPDNLPIAVAMGLAKAPPERPQAMPELPKGDPAGQGKGKAPSPQRNPSEDPPTPKN